MSYQKPLWEIADVARQLDARNLPLHPEEKKVVNAILNCRTEALGGHLDFCKNCGHEDPSYNSCRNRHCPKCGSKAKEKWLEDRKSELLPVGYFHIVFTIPHELNGIFMWNKKRMYTILMDSAKDTIMEASSNEKNLGVKAGMITVLHTWGQNLEFHPHVHCIVPGGGFVGDSWKSSKENFFIHNNRLSALFKGKLLFRMGQAYKKGGLKFSEKENELQCPNEFRLRLSKLKEKKWVVYSKPPFSKPETVLEYLSRYTHRVAISNHRIKKIENGKVFFSWKDYRTSKRKIMSLSLEEFLRRFLLHVLPHRFVKIRFCGFMANKNKKKYVKICREQIGCEKINSSQISEIQDDLFLDFQKKEQQKKCRMCGMSAMETVSVEPFWKRGRDSP